MSEDNPRPRLEEFEGYLLILVHSLWDSQLQARLSPEDLVQDTLLEARKDLEKFRGTTHAEMAGWLRTILTRNIANAFRDNRRAKRDLSAERSLDASLEKSSARFSVWLADDLSTPSEKAMKLEELTRLAKALTRLPIDQRVSLRHLQEASLVEIAREMNRSEASVAGLLRRGLKALREILGDSE